MRTFVLSLVFVCGASFAHASFDLVLVADSTNGVIHRIDGDTGLYLGSFGQGILSNPQSIALDQANSTLYVMDYNSGMTSFNYNTGQALFTNVSGYISSDMCQAPDGRFFLTLASTSTVAMTRIDSIFSNSSTSYPAGAANVHRGIGIDSTGDILVQDTTLNRMLRFNPAVTSAAEAVSASGSFTGTSKGTAVGTTFVALKNDGSMTSINTQTLGGVQTGFAPTAGTFTSVVDVAAGHQNYLWGLGKNASATRLQRYSRPNSAYSFSPLSGFNYTQIANPTAIAVVVAPEPTTMLALGIGSLTLIRKRRKASQK